MAGSATEEILIHAAEDVLRLLTFLVHSNAADKVDQLAEHNLIKGGPVVVLGQNALEAGIVRLNRQHGVDDQLADGGLLGFRLHLQVHTDRTGSRGASRNAQLTRLRAGIR